MQTKTIKKTIVSKLESWIKTLPTELGIEVKENLLLSGGAIANLLQNQPVNDYDIYIQDRSVLMKLVKFYTQKVSGIQIMDGHNKTDLVEELEKDYHGSELEDINNQYSIALRNLKDDQIKLFMYNGSIRVADLEDEPKEGQEATRPPFSPVFYSPNAISLSDSLQIVIRFWGPPEEIHKTFDFVHPTNYFTFKQGLVFNTEALLCIMTKQLRYQGSMYPVTSIIRVRKFLKRGFNINAGELLKIMFQISQLNLSNPDVLEEQLIGVDIAYFGLLIKALRDMFQKNPDKKLEPAYFNTIIDRIFSEAEAGEEEPE